MKLIQEASVTEVWQAYEAQKEHFYMIDVREADELRSMRTVMAHPFPLSSFDPEDVLTSLGLTPNQRVYVLCRSGRRSLHAATLLQAAGCTQVHNVQGGILAWHDAGLPTLESS